MMRVIATVYIHCRKINWFAAQRFRFAVAVTFTVLPTAVSVPVISAAAQEQQRPQATKHKEYLLLTCILYDIHKLDKSVEIAVMNNK